MPAALLQFDTLRFDIWVGALGAASATILIAALTAGLGEARYRIWPSPPAGSVRSAIYWSCFRALNLAVIVLALNAMATDVAGGTFSGFQFVTAAASAAVFAVYVGSLWALGRDATYCNASGLNTAGIYGWSRNPQYATAIVGYSLMALASLSPAVAVLALSLVAVYALMAYSEEPWLEAQYGPTYVRYRADVPRFFNVRRAMHTLSRPASARTFETPRSNSRK